MRMKKQELKYITGSSNESTTRMNLLLGGDLWSEDYPGVSKWMEAQTDRLDYDLRGWEPVEYEYLKVYPAVNSESKISEYTEDGDLIRITTPDNGYDRRPTNRNKKVGLNEDQSQWAVIIRGDLLAEVYPESVSQSSSCELRGSTN
ncbi:hypothetical protein PPACK8108_LOCUS24543 [Phakopsora pachyrhizi]|uniref:Uncharacterized protein n=1 Tax=Phakopsora pachyrhizi TaxID=170000 RepID=A0AAV0BQ13_PHAPC|nr:hypothetical protein PPACK8108_LOCUS24543 [Phakopsora pachyrhizi]